jgi:hypothetical protein
LAWRGAIHVNKGDGATKNIYDSTQTWYNKDRVAGRIQFLLTPTENFNARVSFDIQPTQREWTNGNNFRTPTPRTYANGSVNTLSNDAETRLGRRWFKEGNPNYTFANDYLNKDHFNQDAQEPLKTRSKGGSAELNWNVDGYI